MGRFGSNPCAAFLTVTNRDKSAVWALFDEVGYFPDFFCFARHGAKQGASGFAVVKCLNRDFDAKRKPPDKRIAFSEGQ